MYLNAHLALVPLVSILYGICTYLAVLKLNALGNLLHVVQGDILVEIYVINLFLQEFGMSELACHVAIVGEQEHTCGVAVKTAYRIYSLRAGILYKIHDCLALLWVIDSCHIVLWLVEEHVYLLLQ